MNGIPIRDIHLPDLPGWWPIAPGWWLVLMLLVMLALVVPWLRKKIQHRSLQQLANLEFNHIQTEYEQHQNKARLVQDLSILLRRTGMSYGSRQQAAALIGNDWTNHLDALTDKPFFAPKFGQLLSTGQYQRQPEFDAKALLQCCQQWLQALPRNKVTHQGDVS